MMILYKLLTLLFTFIYHTSNQYATLSYPPFIKSAKITCTAPLPSASTTYTNTFATPFAAIPILAIGISSMSLTPGLSINFKATPTAITINNFNVIITLGTPSTTLITSIHFYYIAIQPLVYNFGPVSQYSPFYIDQKQWTGSTIATIGLGTGDRIWSIGFNRPAGYNDFTHNLACSSLILGFAGTTTNYYYSLQNNCYCSYTISCNFRILVKGSTQLTLLRVKFLMIDTIAMQQVHTKIVSFWSQSYQSGSPINIIPLSYVLANTAIFVGLNSLTINGVNSQTFNIDYLSGTYSFPTSYMGKFHYFFISSSSCHSGSVNNTGLHLCFNGYNGCPFAMNQILTVNKQTNIMKISRSNKYVVLCNNDTLQIYKHNGVNYMLYQAIYLSISCKRVAANKDFSIIVVAKYGSQTLIDVYNYNITSNQWQLRHIYDGDIYIQVSSLAISDNGQTIVLAFNPLGVVNQFYINHYEFNTTLQKYELINRQIITALVYQLKLLTQPSGQIKLVAYISQGSKIIVSRKKYKSGRFYIQTSQRVKPNNISLSYSSKFYFSQNSRVFVLLSQTYYGQITVYQFNSVTNLYQKYQSIMVLIQQYIGFIATVYFQIDHYGLTIICYTRDDTGYYMVIYKRNSIHDYFNLIAIQRTFNTITGSIIEFSNQVIIVTDFLSSVTGSLKIYYCGASVMTSQIIQDGDILMSSIIMQAQISDVDIKLMNLTTQSTQIKTNLSLAIAQTQNVSAQLISDRINMSNSLQIQKQRLQGQIKGIQQRNRQQRSKDQIMHGVMFGVIGILVIVVVGLLIRDKCINNNSNNNKQCLQQRYNKQNIDNKQNNNNKDEYNNKDEQVCNNISEYNNSNNGQQLRQNESYLEQIRDNSIKSKEQLFNTENNIITNQQSFNTLQNQLHNYQLGTQIINNTNNNNNNTNQSIIHKKYNAKDIHQNFSTIQYDDNIINISNNSNNKLRRKRNKNNNLNNNNLNNNTNQKNNQQLQNISTIHINHNIQSFNSLIQ